MEVIGILTIAVCLLFTFINGFHDGCNVIATIISSRSMSPRKALWFACIAEFVGPLVLGTSVAATIGKGVIDFEFFTRGDKFEPLLLFLAAVLGGILWNFVTWWLRMPSSSSHALIGGLLGAGLASYGIACIEWNVFLYKVLLVLFTSPLIGFVMGYVFLKLIVAITRNAHPRVNTYLKNIQVFSMFLLGASHGSNDAQKSMGIIATVMLLTGLTSSFVVVWWVQVICALAISLGLSVGGWRLIKTVGVKIFIVKPIHSFSSQLASAFTILAASITGGPVSTTQIVNSSVMGVGAAERKNAVRWDVVKNILLSWVLTIPSSALLAALIYYLIKYVFSL